jgi:hypothetical protein
LEIKTDLILHKASEAKNLLMLDLVSLWGRVIAYGSHVQSISWEIFHLHSHCSGNVVEPHVVKKSFPALAWRFKTLVVHVCLVKVLCYFILFSLIELSFTEHLYKWRIDWLCGECLLYIYVCVCVSKVLLYYWNTFSVMFNTFSILVMQTRHYIQTFWVGLLEDHNFLYLSLILLPLKQQTDIHYISLIRKYQQ